MSNSLKSFLICFVVVMVGDFIGALLGFEVMSIAYGFTLGMVWAFLYDVFMKPEQPSNQVQIVKDGNTIHIQAGGDITVKSVGSEIVDR